MASQKRVLLQFGDHSRCIDVPSASGSSKSERELLLNRAGTPRHVQQPSATKLHNIPPSEGRRMGRSFCGLL